MEVEFDNAVLISIKNDITAVARNSRPDFVVQNLDNLLFDLGSPDRRRLTWSRNSETRSLTSVRSSSS